MTAVRDDHALADGLARWLGARRGLTDPVVGGLSRPSAGYSSDTVFAEVEWVADDGPHHESLVVRMAPPEVGTFRHYDLVPQEQAQRAAAEAGVPVADPVVETDTRWLGAPFMVMPRVEGHIIGAVAHLDGWLTGLGPADQHRVYDNFVATLAAVHRADVRLRPGRSPSGQHRRARPLGGLPRVVHRRVAGAGSGRRPALVSSPPTGPRAGPGPAVGGCPVREHGAR